MMVEYVELTIDELLLDEDNPRLGAVASQSEALELLVKLNQNHFRNLMLSIRQNGLDPGDSLYVIETDDKEDYTVLEGNRRLSAMMVLLNPDVLNGTDVSENAKKSLLRASEGFDRDTVEPIRCVLFEQREDANDWIYRRHTGSAEGEGRIQWGPTEVQRFTGDRSVLDLIDFVGRNAAYSDEEWASTKSVIESRKSSTLARIIDSAPAKKHLSISIASNEEGKVPMLGSDPAWALSVLRRIIEDVRDGQVDSRELNKASDIEDYFNKLPSDLQPKKGKKPALRAFKEINLKDAAKSKGDAIGQKAKDKTTRAPRVRKSLAPKKHPFNVPTSTKGEQLLREAGLLDADKFKLSSAFVLRGFLELAIDEYMDRKKLPKTGRNKEGRTFDLSMSVRAERVIEDMRNDGVSKTDDIRGFKKRIINATSNTSIQSLNDFIHNRFQIPTADELRSAWDSSTPVFIAAFGKVE